MWGFLGAFFIWPEEQSQVGVALYAAAAVVVVVEEEEVVLVLVTAAVAEGRGSMRQQQGAGGFVRGRPGFAAVCAGRAKPSTRRDLGWLL